MTENLHPLTETRAAELWDKCREESAIPEVHRFDQLHWADRTTALDALRAAFDAGREHERAQADPTIPAEVTDEMVKSALRAEDSVSPHAGGDGIDGFRLADERRVRAALEAALAVTTPADPHHDPRLVDALEAVLEIHKPIQSSITRRAGVSTITVCEHCLEPTWPCPTVTTIRTALNGDNA